MRRDDVLAAERISRDAFYELDVRLHVPGLPEPERRTPERSEEWIRRTQRLLETDPGGSWVADDDDGVAGFATSFLREGLWCLATYAVRPGRQGRGIGKGLLDAATAYGGTSERWMLAASDDPKALRRYRLAGLDLHPQMVLSGTPDRAAIPAVHGVRDGRAEDREWLDDVSRACRGAGHGPDHDALADMSSLVVAEDRSGYAYTSPYVALVAATTEETAVLLLWECLARADGRVVVPHVTGANQWAITVGISARLQLATSGYLGLRGMDPPAPYVHNGALL